MWNWAIRNLFCLFSLLSMSNADHIGNFSQAWKDFTDDPHLAHASYAITIVDSRTGAILFDYAKNVGLPPASSMKTITAAASLHYLGPNFTYETSLQYLGELNRTTGVLDGFIYIIGSGDPSLGSDRYDETIKADVIVQKWIAVIKETGIRQCRGVISDASRWGSNKMMMIDGWTWNDLGNWYGTGHSALNWRENEFKIGVKPGSAVNEPATVENIPNPPPRLHIINELTTAATDGEGSLYFSLDNSNEAILRGTVALDSPSNFYLRCAIPDSALYVADELTQALRKNGIQVEQEANTGRSEPEKLTLLNIHQSPPLSKLLEPFLRISINMYGEAFVKTIAYQTGLSSLLEAPMKILPTYLTTLFGDAQILRGISLTDGSGLSRSNRLTTSTLARILYIVQNESWFESMFYNAFPTINGLRMKSGTLMNTIAYAGYVRENSFVFSFMINNYYGDTAPEMRIKVWKMLDMLK